MRAGALAILSGLILMVLAGQTFQTAQTKLDTPVVAACSVQVEGCNQPSLDESRQFLISHDIFAGGCAGSDLHVMRYGTDAASSRPLVTTWCS